MGGGVLFGVRGETKDAVVVTAVAVTEGEGHKSPAMVAAARTSASVCDGDDDIGSTSMAVLINNNGVPLDR